MALRNIREMGDPVLEKKAKVIKEVTPRLRALAQDMLETMYDTGGVGLAAPQVGILKRLVVIDVTEEQNEPYTMVNPEILEQDGEQTGYEGCGGLPRTCDLPRAGPPRRTPVCGKGERRAARRLRTAGGSRTGGYSRGNSRIRNSGIRNRGISSGLPCGL